VVLEKNVDKLGDCVRNVEEGKVNMELQLDATITVLLISKISSTCFGQTFAHLQECKT
jgi:S-adenosylmethionine hydrolase